MLRLRLSTAVPGPLFGLAALGVLLLNGCGVGTIAPADAVDATGAITLGGIVKGGNNPINGAAITVYVTTSAATTTNGGYGQPPATAGANVIATTTTGADGSWSVTLPSGSQACPTGQFAYVVASGGKTGSNTANTSSLLMAPGGSCASLYSYNSGSGVNTYSGPTHVIINEVSTIISAYALGNFTGVSGTTVNISAPANNNSTASTSTPSAAGLAHAFANALAIFNTTNGVLNATTANNAVIPDGEIFLLGNILESCVNSTGPSGTNTRTSNDGTSCGILFSMTTPLSAAGVSPPTNTLQAMLNLVKYPNPTLNTWNAACTTSASGTTTADQCLYNLSSAVAAPYQPALNSPPPDWTLALVYPSGTGAQTSGSNTNPGLAYPFYVALDYQDNVYVLNYNGGYNNNGASSGATTSTNIIGFKYDGTPVFSTTPDTTDLTMPNIGTDTLGHVFGAATGASTGVMKVYNTSSGSLATTVTTGLNAADNLVIADPAGNIYVESGTLAGINLRKVTAGTYAVANATASSGTFGPFLQLAWDSSVDLYGLSSTTPNVEVLPNIGSYSAPSFASGGSFTYNSGTLSGTTGANPPGVWGIAGNGLGSTTNNAYVLTSAGVTPITSSGSAATTAIAAGSATSLPELPNDTSTSSFRGAWVDGSSTLFTPDGDNGAGQSGVAVYNATTGYLGTYKGCFVSASACGTTAGTAPMFSARGLGIDSSGDVWVASGASATLTELIGVAAPTWPGLSMAKFGRPQ
jgi:hypothetical protein